MTATIDEAKAVIFGDREKVYGDPGKNLETIATYWETYLISRGMWNPDSGAMHYYDVCHMMALLKLARLGNDPTHRDSNVDTIGYMALADRVMRKEDPTVFDAFLKDGIVPEVARYEFFAPKDVVPDEDLKPGNLIVKEDPSGPAALWRARQNA